MKDKIFKIKFKRLVKIDIRDKCISRKRYTRVIIMIIRNELVMNLIKIKTLTPL